MLAPGSRIERNWATEEEQQGNCGREEERWVTERELLARSSIHSGHNTQTLHYNMDPLLVGQTDIGLHGRLLTSRSSSVVHSSVSVQLRFILFRLQIDSKTDRVSYCTYGMAYSESEEEIRRCGLNCHLRLKVICIAYVAMHIGNVCYANHLHMQTIETPIWTIEAGNVERGHVPRSMFLVPKRERSGSENNLV